MAWKSEKREVNGCLSDVKTFTVPAKRETGGSCAIIAIIGLSSVTALIAGGITAVAQTLG
ncbi:MAG: hypothetical protein HZB75_04705 [Candidatus Saccharibacteria bacterium]|jgi:hypothetical protein|nr:MAG: hypothetical protein HZB75_04705 [Candidatus Saccharibacteria bacterium]